MDDAGPLSTPQIRTGDPTSYERDVIVWSREQAALLRTGDFSRLDIEHIADEIEDVGKSEQNELTNRTAILLAHLLKWKYQPERRSRSWLNTINEQRRKIHRRLVKTPSLKTEFNSDDWLSDAWFDALSHLFLETTLADLPTQCLWTREQILEVEFLPD